MSSLAVFMWRGELRSGYEPRREGGSLSSTPRLGRKLGVRSWPARLDAKYVVIEQCLLASAELDLGLITDRKVTGPA